jgi:hypothetical protein
MKCRLDTDMWRDAGVVYFVHSYKNYTDSTAIHLDLEHPDGTREQRVVCSHQINWEEDET